MPANWPPPAPAKRRRCCSTSAPQEEWAQGHLPGALHLDRGYLELRAETLVPDKAGPVVCYCGSGVRSLFAAQALRTLGYQRVQSLARGFAGWKEAGLPFVQPVALSEAQRRRYMRHLAIPEVGEDGQAKLLAAKVLCIGAGGLGCPAAIYLAAAGVGTLGIVDDDEVDESNLQRQILHTTARVGTAEDRQRAHRHRGAQPGRQGGRAYGAAVGRQRARHFRPATTWSSTAPTISRRAIWSTTPA